MNNGSSKSKSKNRNRNASAGKKGSSAGKVSTSAKTQPGGLSLGAKIAIGVIAVVLGLSMMLPSLSAIFSNSSSSSDTSTDQSSSADTSDSSDSSDSSTTSTVSTIDTKYSPLVTTLEAKLANDPENLATLLNLGRDYMQWGVQVIYNGTTSADTTHGNDLLSKAVSYFNQYLALNDSNSVKVDCALCQLYGGDTSGALAALQKITTDTPDYGPAWANLGLVYEMSSDTDSAVSAYEKAEATDADNEYGAKSYAAQRIAAIKSSSTTSGSGSSTTASGSSTTSSNKTTGLSDTLAGISDTSL